MTDRDDAMEAMESAVDQLKDLHASADNAAIVGKREQEIIDGYIDTVAKALSSGVNDPVGLYAGAAADEAVYYSKTDIKQKTKDRIQSVRGDDTPALDEFVRDDLESVTVLKTTDQHQGAIYTWDFGNFKVETNSGEDSRGHFGFAHFRDLIFESGGLNIALPTEERRGGGDWRDFMIKMVDERGTVVTNVGPRTAAKEELANKIRRRVAYGTAEGAVNHSGVWVLTQQPVPESWAFPDWWAPLMCEMQLPLDRERSLEDACVNITEIRVHESLITPLVDDSEITRSALYHELNARNLTIPGTPGTSLTEWVNGRTERFWALRQDIAQPDVYVPNPTQSCSFSELADIRTSSPSGESNTQQATADGGSIAGTDDPGVDDGSDAAEGSVFKTVGDGEE